MFICAILKDERPEILSFNTFEEFSEYANQMMRAENKKEIEYYDLTCYYCKSTGSTSQEEKSGGHIEAEDCESCSGSGVHGIINQLEKKWNPPFSISSR